MRRWGALKADRYGPAKQDTDHRSTITVSLPSWLSHESARAGPDLRNRQRDDRRHSTEARPGAMVGGFHHLIPVADDVLGRSHVAVLERGRRLGRQHSGRMG